MEGDAIEIGGEGVPPNPTALVSPRSGRVTEVTGAFARAPVAKAMRRGNNGLANSLIAGCGVGMGRTHPLSFVPELFALKLGMAYEIWDE